MVTSLDLYLISTDEYVVIVETIYLLLDCHFTLKHLFEFYILLKESIIMFAYLLRVNPSTLAFHCIRVAVCSFGYILQLMSI